MWLLFNNNTLKLVQPAKNKHTLYGYEKSWKTIGSFIYTVVIIAIIFITFYFNLLVSIELVFVLASSAGDRGFEPRSGQSIDYNIDICFFYA
jgi:hypothetical protein